MDLNGTGKGEAWQGSAAQQSRPLIELSNHLEIFNVRTCLLRSETIKKIFGAPAHQITQSMSLEATIALCNSALCPNGMPKMPAETKHTQDQLSGRPTTAVSTK
jgi:hypothetical protein